MDDKLNLVESNHSEEKDNQSVNTELLESIKNFMDDLSNVTTSENFKDYHTIVKRIDKTKVKAYHKLIKGFTTFFSVNSIILTNDENFELIEPNISYSTDNGSFSFNLQEAFHSAEEADQDVIKDHLNHIWSILEGKNNSPEEKYIDKIFRDLKIRFSPDLTREEQMMIAKDLFSDFQKQDLDISIVVKAACQKARELLLKNGADTTSQTMVLIEAVEEIDINNFNMIQFMGLVGKIGTLFSDGENNPLNGLLSSVFDSNNLIAPIDVEYNSEGGEDH
ncbi:hypothetical protein WIV_gp029 [Wiseana iridescent virus]|uniref:Uncharacterized protein n=1 Tax=Wiseana iridescent virus TaxID=68347 RepID=G0T555_IRV9|nr:hypothetical protein WIV_gp029 [Wiseana iridescent virus]ADO00372.1 hypothetical protein [Wiseana iridescent virus]